MYRMNKDNKIAVLLKQKEIIFHTQDLMVLWDVYNKNTLYTTIKRYCQKEVLYSIQKGMYSVIPINKIDVWLLGSKALYKYNYVSTETILVKEGIINQVSDKITLISSKSLKFELNGNFFVSRQLADKFLFNNSGIVVIDGVRQAVLARAVADMLYFNPKFYFDNQKLINWRLVKKIQKKVGY